MFTATVFGFIAFFLLSMSFGEKTLWQHLVGISETEEAEELKTEIEKKVDKATSDLKDKASKMAEKELHKRASDSAGSHAPPAEDELTKEDRRELKKLIRAKKQEEEIRSDQAALQSLIREKRRENRSPM